MGTWTAPKIYLGVRASVEGGAQTELARSVESMQYDEQCNELVIAAVGSLQAPKVSLFVSGEGLFRPRLSLSVATLKCLAAAHASLSFQPLGKGATTVDDVALSVNFVNAGKVLLTPAARSYSPTALDTLLLEGLHALDGQPLTVVGAFLGGLRGRRLLPSVELQVDTLARLSRTGASFRFSPDL